MRVLGIRADAFETPRLTRAMESLAEAGYETTILYWNREISAEHKRKIREQIKSLTLNSKVNVVELLRRKAHYGKGIWGLGTRLVYMWNIFRFLIKYGQNYQIIHAINIDSAFPAALYKCLINHHIMLVYDIADFIETYPSLIPNILRKSIRWIDRKIMHTADALILPDENRFINIPNQMRDKAIIVNNAPHIDVQKVKDRAQQLTLRPSNKIRVIYYGGLSRDRGIDMLLQVGKELEEYVDIYIAGWGEMADTVARASCSSHNIYFLGSLTQEEVLTYLYHMDISYIMYSPNYEHNRLASPNKLFEAMALGKPVIVARDTSIDKLVHKHDMGYAIDYCASALREILRNIERTSLQQKGRNAQYAYEMYKWEHSKTRLLDLYKKLISQGSIYAT